MANTQEIYLNVNTNEIITAAEAMSDLEKELLVLRLAFGKFKAAVRDAVEPLRLVLLPVLQQAVWAATRVVKAVGKVIGALFGQGKAAKTAAKNQDVLAKANENAKRSLAGFDEINQLNTSDGVQPTENETTAVNDTLSPQLQGVVDKIMGLLTPLQQIDFSPAIAAFGRLKEAITPIDQSLFAGLEWAWYNLLVPLAAWTIEDLLPAFLETLTSALSLLNAVIVALQPAADWLWENFLKPIGQWAGEQIIQALGWLRERLDGISTWVSENQELAQKIAIVAAAIGLVNLGMKGLGSLGGTTTGILSGLAGSLNGVQSPATLVTGAIRALSGAIVLLIANWDGVKTVAATVWNTVRQIWGGAANWFRQNLLTPLSNGFRNTVNGIIGFLNQLISAFTAVINGIVQGVNKLQLDIPDWVPGLGGKQLGFHLTPLSVPQIPYLAKGAVLPANKPFMAVVGDQKHGTNVEAPLDTIKQAVAEVLGSQTDTVVQVNFTGDLAQLARVLKPAIDTENRRRGNSLAKGVL